MTVDIYQVDAFSSHLFKGNPAAVCLLNEWLPDETLKSIAAENNLSETAYVIARDDHFELRWFTPTVEVSLCGHATVATALVLFDELKYENSIIRFQTKSGELTVRKDNNFYLLNFPANDPTEVTDYPNELIEALHCKPVKVLKGKTDYMVVVETQREVELLQPNHTLLRGIKVRGVIVTAVGDEVDFVSRFFAPGSGVDEDPVTGSAHTMLIPYWAKKLGKEAFYAKQLSARGGTLKCKLLGDRVEIGGAAKLYMKGQLFLP
ncbi:isomerase [Solitalea longa]|uniref:Isomerase n=1 Tax=Solitalea longa TaxID=2079460 RepID=A0A2S5A995_9SPHI|nr:PhzF family phenazine biosynthesis protein [Solitalea longa]POY39135.1 isomerase [Solitalea longa]